MAKLSTQFMGMELKNPVLAAPGPWTGTAEGLQAAIDAGAGAVMTETISQEVYPRLPQTCYHEGGAVFSTSLYSNLTLEQWEVELEKLHPGDCKVIASIRGATPSELAYVARKAERMGVDALQLDLYAPIGPVLAELYTSPDLIAALVSAVKKKVSLPLMVRLPHYLADNKKFLRALETAGADGICTIESIRGISGVDMRSCTNDKK